MTENTCEMLMQVSAVLRTLILIVCFMGLWNHIIDTEFKTRKVILYFAIAFHLLILVWMDFPPYLRYLPIFAVCIIYVYVFKICKWEKTIFLLLFLYNLHTMSFLIANSIYQVLCKYMDGRLDMSAPNVVEKIYFHTGILQILLMVLYALILLILYLVFISMNPKIKDMSVTELIFLSVLNVVGIILAYMIVGLTVVPLEEEVFILYDEASDFLWKVPIMAMLILVGEYSSIHIFCRYKKFLVERESVISRELGLQQLEQRFEEAQVLYGNFRSLRHDIKNHIQTIQGLSLSGERQATKAYVEKLNELIEEIDGKFNTGNTLCDVILNGKYRVARKSNIEFSVDFRYESGISDFDLGIILSNLCDNAIEACQKVQIQNRKIDISFMGDGPCVLLSVRNSYDGKEILFGENGLPLSSKNVMVNASGKSVDHGIGLKNVSVIAESYLGKMQLETKENEFLVTVMLQKRDNVSPVTT